MITCTKEFRFEAGHRLLGHKGACKNVHGHSYRVEVTIGAIAGEETDDLGVVVDFQQLSKTVGQWLEANWDHAMILYSKDPLTTFWLHYKQFQGMKQFILPYNPTAENMAAYLLDEVCPSFFGDSDLRVSEVTVWETEKCKATAKLPNSSA